MTGLGGVFGFEAFVFAAFARFNLCGVLASPHLFDLGIVPRLGVFPRRAEEIDNTRIDAAAVIEPVDERIHLVGLAVNGELDLNGGAMIAHSVEQCSTVL